MPRSASRQGHGLLVAGATAAANVLAYALSVVASRRLGLEGFGQVASLLAVVLVASVPGQALQAGIARRSAHHADRATDGSGEAVAGAAVGAAVFLVLLALSPVLQAVLKLSALSAPAWAAVSVLPQTVCFACLGLLQGHERFRRLSVAVVLVQAARLAGGVGGVLIVNSPAGMLAGTTAGLAAAAVASCILAGVTPWHAGTALRPALDGLVRNTSAVLSVVVLTNLDLLLARNRLAGSAAGTYAAGALVAKMAFFAPSFAAVLLFPRLARPADRGRALRTGAGVLAASAALSVGGAVVGRAAVPLVLGGAYRPLESLVWLFAASGSALAAVHLLVQAGLAAGNHVLSALVWIAVALEVLVVVAVVHSVTALVLVVLGLAITLVVTGAFLELRPASRRYVSVPVP